MEDPELFWFCLSIHNSCKAQKKAKREEETRVKHRSKDLDYTRRVMTSCLWLMMSDGRWCCCSILLLYRSLSMSAMSVFHCCFPSLVSAWDGEHWTQEFSMHNESQSTCSILMKGICQKWINTSQ